MNKIKVLDCTLRDGGYVNNWEFGEKNIAKIINKLSEAKIDIVECGFLTNKYTFDSNITQYDNANRLDLLLNDTKSNSHVLMINYGEYSLDDIPDRSATMIDGLRVAFHKKDRSDAINFCEGLVKKGYKTFIQPMVSISYTDMEFIELIQKANEIRPYAFYIVDSFGVIKRKDLERLYYLVDNNLSSDIAIGYHAHNNMQLAYSNAQTLVDIKTDREIIIDSSVFGMGRGAGNLNTELFIEYLNDNEGKNYKQAPILKIIDEVLNHIYKSKYWGYSLAYYVSSIHNCHPNYATYLDNKATLRIEDINNILSMLSADNKAVFKKDLIEELYAEYQAHNIDDTQAREHLKNTIGDRSILLLAPGKSLAREASKVKKFISETDPITISVNFVPGDIDADFVFYSNRRRYSEGQENQSPTSLVTSNIKSKQNSHNEYILNYLSLLNSYDTVSENSGLMIIKLLRDLGVKRCSLVGFDGYSLDSDDDYSDKSLVLIKNKETVKRYNTSIEKAMSEFSRDIDLNFVTRSRYEI